MHVYHLFLLLQFLCFRATPIDGTIHNSKQLFAESSFLQYFLSLSKYAFHSMLLWGKAEGKAETVCKCLEYSRQLDSVSFPETLAYLQSVCAQLVHVRNHVLAHLVSRG